MDGREDGLDWIQGRTPKQKLLEEGTRKNKQDAERKDRIGREKKKRTNTEMKDGQ